MAINKSWIQSRRSRKDYFEGVPIFIDYMSNHIHTEDKKAFVLVLKVVIGIN